MKNLEYIVFLAKAGIQQLLFYIFYLQSFTRITTVKLLATLGDGKTDMVSEKSNIQTDIPPCWRRCRRRIEKCIGGIQYLLLSKNLRTAPHCYVALVHILPEANLGANFHRERNFISKLTNIVFSGI